MFRGSTSAITGGELTQWTTAPDPPALTAPKKARVRASLEALGSRGKKGAFGAKVEKDLTAKLTQAGLPGDNLTAEEAYGFCLPPGLCPLE